MMRVALTVVALLTATQAGEVTCGPQRWRMCGYGTCRPGERLLYKRRSTESSDDCTAAWDALCYPVCATCESGDCYGGWRVKSSRPTCPHNGSVSCPRNTATCCDQKCSSEHCTGGQWALKSSSYSIWCDGPCPSRTTKCCERQYCQASHCTGVWAKKSGSVACPSGGCQQNTNHCCTKAPKCTANKCTGHWIPRPNFASIACYQGVCPSNTNLCCKLDGCDKVRVVSVDIAEDDSTVGEPQIKALSAFTVEGVNCGVDQERSLEGWERTTVTGIFTEESLEFGESLEQAYGWSSSREVAFEWSEESTYQIDAVYKAISGSVGYSQSKSWSTTSSFTEDQGWTVGSDTTKTSSTAREKSDVITFRGTSIVPAFAWHRHRVVYNERAITMRLTMRLQCIINGQDVGEPVEISGSEIVTGTESNVQYAPMEDKTDECVNHDDGLPEYANCVCFPGLRSAFHPAEGCQPHWIYGRNDGYDGCYVYKGANCGNNRGLRDADPKDYNQDPELVRSLTVDFPVDGGMFEWSYVPCNHPRYASDDRSVIHDCSEYVEENPCTSSDIPRHGYKCDEACDEEQCCGTGIDLKISFQPAHVVPPRNYLVDSGELFGTRVHGIKYGWSSVATALAFGVEKESSLVETPAASGSRWEIEIPNGNYDVTVGFSHPQEGVETAGCKIEGSTTSVGECNHAISATQAVAASSTVTVEDGMLTLSGDSSECSSWSYVHVKDNTGDFQPPEPETTRTYHWDNNSGMLGWSSTTSNGISFRNNEYKNIHGMLPYPFNSRDLPHSGVIKATSENFCKPSRIEFKVQGGVSPSSNPDAGNYAGVVLLRNGVVFRQAENSRNHHLPWTTKVFDVNADDDADYKLQLRDGKTGGWGHIEIQDVVITARFSASCSGRRRSGVLRRLAPPSVGMHAEAK